jgi:hypothetical protein
VAICPHHDRLLEHVCPGCNQSQPIFAAKTRVGRCSHCHDWLGAASTADCRSRSVSERRQTKGHRDLGCSEERKVWLSWLTDRSLEVIAAPQHRPTAAIRQVIIDYLNGVGKDNRNVLWWQKYSAEAPEHQISDDDRLTLLNILAREIPT